MFKTLTKTAIVATIATFTGISSAAAHDYKIGDLFVDHPVARATAPGAKVGGGFMTIENTGTTADRLIGGTADFAGKIEIHQMNMVNDIMKMKRVKGGLEIGPGETVVLKPGSYHIMFMQLKEPLAKGEKRNVRLTFEKAGSIDVKFKVKSIANTMH